MPETPGESISERFCGIMPPMERVGPEMGILRSKLGETAPKYQFGEGAAKAAA
jgi:hypothetical protein